MFGKKESNENAAATEKLSIVSDVTELRGDIETSGHLRIDGNVKGNISALANVAIGKSGNVVGNISAGTLKISGNVKGNISVANRLVIDSSARIKGDVKTKILVVEAGAVIDGTLSMELREEPTKDFNEAVYAK
jgi:cytoskeletal protein CcmA (bactofilin family)